MGKLPDIPNFEFPDGSPFPDNRQTILGETEIFGDDIIDSRERIKVVLSALVDDTPQSAININGKSVIWEELMAPGYRCVEADGVAHIEHIGLLRWLYSDLSVQIPSSYVPIFEDGRCASPLLDSCKNVGSRKIGRPLRVLRLREEIKVGDSSRCISAKPVEGDDVSLKIDSNFDGPLKGILDRRGISALRANLSPEFIYAVAESRSNHGWLMQTAIDFFRRYHRLEFLAHPLMQKVYGRTADLRHVAFNAENIFVPDFSEQRKEFMQDGINFEIAFHAAADFLGLAGFLPGRPVGAEISRFCGGHTLDREFWDTYLKNAQAGDAKQR
ncbi:MAG: hypothetical protein K9L85_01265 [Candidatus Peribacteraceae bacterium]|nr:hypothetical protein [Candidatus Peribacteraceae bacterium]